MEIIEITAMRWHEHHGVHEPLLRNGWFSKFFTQVGRREYQVTAARINMTE